MYPQERIFANEQRIKKLLQEMAENDYKLTEAIKRVEQNKKLDSNIDKPIHGEKTKTDSFYELCT